MTGTITQMLVKLKIKNVYYVKAHHLRGKAEIWNLTNNADKLASHGKHQYEFN